MGRKQIQEAETLLEMGLTDDAARLLERVLAAEPEDVRAMCLLSWVLLQRGDPEEALATADRAVATAPVLEWAQRMRGIALRALGEPERALEALRHAAGLDPEEWRPVREMADLLLADLNRVEEAAAAAEQLDRIAPELPGNHELWARIDLDRGRPVESEEHCRKFLAEEPQHPRTLHVLSLALKEQGRREESLEALPQAFAADPTQDWRRQKLEEEAREYVDQGIPQLTLVAWLNPLAALALGYQIVFGKRRRLRRLSPALRSFVRVGIGLRRSLVFWQATSMVSAAVLLGWTVLLTQDRSFRPGVWWAWAIYGLFWGALLYGGFRILQWLKYKRDYL